MHVIIHLGWNMSSIGTGVRGKATLLSAIYTCTTKTHIAANTQCFLSVHQYDLSASQFSPDGRVFQIEYAAKAVENSGWVRDSCNVIHHLRPVWIYVSRTAVALRGKDGVVFAVEKLVTSKLHEPGSNKLIFTVDEHVGVVRISSFVVWFSVHYKCPSHPPSH